MRRPSPLVSIQHVAITVTDVDASVRWYAEVLGLERLLDLPHDGGFGALMATPDRALMLVVHHHDDNDGARFTETRTGLDHIGFQVEDRTELEAWRAWFDAHGVTQSPIATLEEVQGAVLVFRDPDGIQLELYAP